MDFDDLDGAEDDAAEAAEANAPVLVLCYSGGMTGKQGRESLKDFMAAAEEAGLGRQYVLDHFPEPPYDACKTWEEMIDLMVERLESDAACAGRKLILFGHSLGCNRLYGVAKKLGGRVLKAYLCGGRPPFLPSFDEVWGPKCNSAEAVKDLTDEALLKGMVGAWANPLLDPYVGREAEKWPAYVKDIMSFCRRQYSHPTTPFGSKDNHVMLTGNKVLACPILAVCARKETRLGETAEKLKRWEELCPEGRFELATVHADHFGCMRAVKKDDKKVNPPLYEIVLADMKRVLAEHLESVA